ncbi:MAG: AMP-binding protein [Azoarcus sp.]|nr:AMP-binding protein [Azoarcus sp.]
MTITTQQGWTAGQQDTINDVVRRAVRDHGGRLFVDFLGVRHTYAEMHERVCRIANGLIDLGIKKNDTVVTLLDNSDEAVFVWLALNKVGAISVPVNTAYKGEFLRHQVTDAGAQVIIAETDYAERVVAIAGVLPELRTLVYRGAKPELKGFDRQVLSWASLYSDHATDPMIDVQPGDLSMLIYTGGTTGLSKGCMVSHNYACNFARQMLVGTNRTHETVTWTPLPLFHFNAVSSSFLCNMLVGASVALYSRFSVSNFWPEVERTKATDCSLLGTMFTLLARADDSESMHRCKGQLHAAWGAPFPAEIQEIWKARFGVKYTQAVGYGLTECSVVTLQPYDRPAKVGASGFRADCYDVRIIDDNDVELPEGTAGEIMVRPRQPHVMFEGYWKRPEDTLKVMRNLWFHTGDIGKFDENGYFFFLDRKKDYLRRKGENISSMEVENLLRTHPEIEDAAAHAVLSDLSEDELKITVTLRAEARLTEEALFHWCVDQFPYFAVPRYIEFRADLPRNPVGRVQKFQLREEGVTPTTWDQEKAGIQIKKR